MKFEDAAFLFNCHHSNRGMIRLDFDEAACLWRHISPLESAHGVEIGRLGGGSTLLLAMAMGGGRLLSIDKTPTDDEKLRSELSRLGLGFVDLVTADSTTHRDAGVFDFAFIDGDHSYRGAMLDHLLWGSRVKPGGLIIHHDMSKTRPIATQIADLGKLRDDIPLLQNRRIARIDEAASLCVFRVEGPEIQPLLTQVDCVNPQNQ